MSEKFHIEAGEVVQREISDLELRYESFKTRNPEEETRLLASLAEGDMREPIAIAEHEGRIVVLDGFKRLRCAQKLKWSLMPCQVVAECELDGLVWILRLARGKRLDAYAEACFVEELHRRQGLSLEALAGRLERSLGWVSMRLRFWDSMSGLIRKEVQSGRFPLYAYLYVVRRFMRMKGGVAEAETFVTSVAGQGLSLRRIELLCTAWYEGSEQMREEIRSGKYSWVEDRLQSPVESGEALSSAEQKAVKDLRRLDELMQSLSVTCQHKGLGSRSFRATAHILLTGILSRQDSFYTKMRRWHESCGRT